MKRLWAWLKRRTAGRRKRPAPSRPPLENPYRRFYTPERSFEELAHRARERQKDPPRR